MEKVDFDRLNVGDRVWYVVDIEDFENMRRGEVVAKEIDTWVIIKVEGENEVQRVDVAFIATSPHEKIAQARLSAASRREPSEPA